MSRLALGLVGAGLLSGAQMIGWGGFGTGVLLVLAIYAVAYGWKRLQQHRAESAKSRPG